jgi:hypothetical protein
MITNDKINKLIEAIEKNTSRRTLSDNDDYVYEACGGNFDDAYSLGREDGITDFSRDLMNILELPYTIEEEEDYEGEQE